MIRANYYYYYYYNSLDVTGLKAKQTDRLLELNDYDFCYLETLNVKK